MNQILADLLRTTGRIEEKIDALTPVIEDHTRRIAKMEGKWAKAGLVISAVTFPVTYVWHRISRKDA